MATVKVVLRKRQKKDGTYPLALRITHKRRTAYVYLSKNVELDQWNDAKRSVKRSHPNATRLNSLIVQRVADVSTVILDYELQKKSFTLEDIKDKAEGIIKGCTTGIGSSTNELSSVFVYADEYFAMLKLSQNYNRYSAERPALSHLRRFLMYKNDGRRKAKKDITFSEITISLLEEFRAYLRGEVKASERTVYNILVVLRTLYKRAIKDEVIGKDNYPFGKESFQLKKPESLKIGLDREEVKRLEQLDIMKYKISSTYKSKSINPTYNQHNPYNYEYHARNVWLYSFYLAGMRVSDVLLSRWSDIKGDRLYYVMNKNNKPGSLKIPDKALYILDQYRDKQRTTDDLVFPDLKNIDDLTNKERVKRKIKEVNRRINASLKELAIQAEIDKPLTMHIARHTFGNISGDKIPIQMLQKLYRHSSITTTVNYQKNFLFQQADDALDSVLDF